MSGYRLCSTRLAQHPFFIESISVNIYSVEELCFFLYYNPYLIDDTIISEKLTKWLAEELHLSDTALQMEQVLYHAHTSMDFLRPLFRNQQYLSPSELKNYQNLMRDIELSSVWNRVRRKADTLLSNEKIAEAIRIYQRILEQYEEDEDEVAASETFLASVWLHLGIANMRLFQYEEGSRAFWQSYQKENSRKTLSLYLLSLKFALPNEKYRDQVETMEIDAELLEQVDEVYDDAVTHPFDWKMGKPAQELQNIIKEYRNAVR